MTRFLACLAIALAILSVAVSTPLATALDAFALIILASAVLRPPRRRR